MSKTRPANVQKKRKFKRKKQQTIVVALPQKTPQQPSVPQSTTTQKVQASKQTLSPLFLLLIPLLLFISFFLLLVINTVLLQRIVRNTTTVTTPKVTINPYPLVANVPLIPLTAQSAIVMDVNSFVVPFSKNPHEELPMASTTKLMTALVALEYFQKDSVITVKHAFPEGSRLDLQAGQQFAFENLLYAMLLPSANDAAEVIASNYPGGVPAFVARMNEKAKQYHLANTTFVDPTGLDEKDKTTVTDMARLAAIAVQNKTIKAVTGTKEKVITDLAGKQYYLHNLNKLLGIDGVTGLKTGTTDAAGEVLVTSVTIDTHQYIIVVMKSEDRFADTTALISFFRTNVQYITPSLPQ